MGETPRSRHELIEIAVSSLHTAVLVVAKIYVKEPRDDVFGRLKQLCETHTEMLELKAEEENRFSIDTVEEYQRRFGGKRG